MVCRIERGLPRLQRDSTESSQKCVFPYRGFQLDLSNKLHVCQIWLDRTNPVFILLKEYRIKYAVFLINHNMPFFLFCK